MILCSSYLYLWQSDGSVREESESGTVSDIDGGKAKESTSHLHTGASTHSHEEHMKQNHQQHDLDHEKSDTSNSAVNHQEVRSSVKAADSPSPSGTVEAEGKTEARAFGSPFESPPILNVSGRTDDPAPSRPHELSTPSLAMMATADEEAPDVSHAREGGGNEEPVDDTPDSLPIALQVAPPPELLERVQKLEDKQRVAGEAIPVDMEEQRRLEEWIRHKHRWTVSGCIVLALAILGIVLGVTLGKKSEALGTLAPTLNPTSESFASFKALIESISFDGGAALSDPLSPQYKALTWLERTQNLEDYPEWKTIQRYALAVLYYSTNGESWTKSDGWLMDEDECTWYTDSTATICDESGAFERLVLYGNNLMGPFPAEVALLSDSLKTLGFADDMLTGTIPSELGLLTNLEGFLFSDCAVLSGTIPSELGRLASENLTVFSLRGASVSGTIPPEIFALPYVEQFSLGSNDLLTGSIPTEIGIASNLRSLDLSSSNFEGTIPTEFGRLSLLEWLVLASNMLNGTIASEIGLLTRLEGLSFSQNSVSGNIPSEIGRLTSLVIMEIKSNRLLGPIPSEIGNLVKLESLDLDGLGLDIGGLNGTIPVQLGNLSSAKYIYIGNNSLTGTLPTELGLLSGLIQLGLNSNSLTGYIPAELGNLLLLEQLWLFSNMLNGTIPVELTQMTNLIALSLGGNPISGSIPSAVGRWTNLDSLHLFESALTGTIPSEIGLLTNLKVCNLGLNSLTGNFPSEIGLLVALEQITISSSTTEMNGTIPSEFGKLSSLTNFILFNVSMDGMLPTEIGSLTSLYSLSVTGNNITGPIPSELGHLTRLGFLYLGVNMLTGTIPTELGALSNLVQLIVGVNSLTGTIPTFVNQLMSLDKFWANDNNLTGSFTCPDFIEECFISCTSEESQCRQLE